jgi:nicotinate-nucleotide pyrophosphorylase (carboxylating)
VGVERREVVGHMVRIEVEVDTLSQIEEMLTLGPDAVLLDNMSLDDLARAVQMVDGAP